MRGLPGCPRCHGEGVILDPNPEIPARLCPCTKTVTEAQTVAVPPRYRAASFEGFWDWWKTQHPREALLRDVREALQFLEHPAMAETLRPDLRNGLELILHKCGAKLQPQGDAGVRDLKAAQEPQGYRPLYNWAKHDRDHAELWWIDGAPGSGRSTLAAAVLKGWCERSGQAGRFISVRTLSQELKDTYYDHRGWQNTDFVSERDRMAPLLQAPCLVLDDLDRMDTDIRVVRALAQLLDHRWSHQLPTVVTALRWAESLQATSPEHYPLLRLEDASLLHRLAQARRVVMRPTLSRLMDALKG